MPSTIADMTCVTSSTTGVAAADLRSHLARWPTGVTIITARGEGGRAIGKTVNSFHSTSLSPPLVGWCIDHASSQFDEWIQARGYVVHVMAGDQMEWVTRFATSGSDRFADVEATAGLDGMPTLPIAVPLRLECRVVDRFPVGDHTYLIGHVHRLSATEAVPMTLQR